MSRVESLPLHQQAPHGENETDVPIEHLAIEDRSSRDRNLNGKSDDATPPNGQLRRDYEKAFELLDRAALAFNVLIDRCRRMEQDLSEVSSQADTRVAELDESIEQWKRLATGLKGQLDVADQRSADLSTRHKAAEARAELAEARVRALETASLQAAEYATAAEALSTKLHDRVVKSFGIGSPAHAVLEVVAKHPPA